MRDADRAEAISMAEAGEGEAYAGIDL